MDDTAINCMQPHGTLRDFMSGSIASILHPEPGRVSIRAGYGLSQAKHLWNRQIELRCCKLSNKSDEHVLCTMHSTVLVVPRNSMQQCAYGSSYLHGCLTSRLMPRSGNRAMYDI